MRRGGEGESKAGIEVDEGDDIPSRTVDVLLEGVESDHVPRIPSNQSLRLSDGFLSYERLDMPGAGDTKRDHPETAKVDNEASDGAIARRFDLVPDTELPQERQQLFFAEIRAEEPNASELFEDERTPCTTSLRLRRPAAGVERLQLAVTCLERSLSAGTRVMPIRNCLADGEGFEPSKGFNALATLAVWYFRPLSHPSLCNYSTVLSYLLKCFGL